MPCLSCCPLSVTDLAAVVAVDRLCFGGLWSQDAYQRELDSPNSDLLVLTVDDADDWIKDDPNHPSNACGSLVGVGCTWSILDEAHITLLGILPTHQRQGLGQWLLIQLLKAARDRGLTHATLEVRQSNIGARTLYQKFGFRVAGERRRYYADGETALILWKNDLQHNSVSTDLEDRESRLMAQLERRGWKVFPASTLADL